MRIFGYAVSWAGLVVVGSLLQGLVLSVLWGWFVIPVFHVGPITIPLALGLTVIVGMVTTRSSSQSKEDEKKSASDRLITGFCYALIPPLVSLVIGAIVHAFA